MTGRRRRTHQAPGRPPLHRLGTASRPGTHSEDTLVPHHPEGGSTAGRHAARTRDRPPSRCHTWRCRPGIGAAPARRLRRRWWPRFAAPSPASVGIRGTPQVRPVCEPGTPGTASETAPHTPDRAWRPTPQGNRIPGRRKSVPPRMPDSPRHPRRRGGGRTPDSRPVRMRNRCHHCTRRPCRSLDSGAYLVPPRPGRAGRR